MEKLKRKTFFTDKEVEEQLQSIQRKLIGLDGKPFFHTNFSMYWETFDDLILCRNVTTKEVLTRAQEYVDEDGAIFEDGFRWAISEFYYKPA